MFKRMARNIHTEVITEIFRGEGPLLRELVPELSHVVLEYKKLLRKAGREIVELLKLSEETKEELQKALIPYDTYVKGWNASIDNEWNRSDMIINESIK